MASKKKSTKTKVRRADAAKARAKLTRRNLPLLMLVTREAVASYFRPTFRSFDLTEQQWRLIRSLYEDGERTIGQLSQRSQIIGPSLTGVLNRMLNSGLIRKRAHPGSRRVYISLTRYGRNKIENMIPHILAGFEELERDIGRDELEHLYETLERILDKIGPPTGYLKPNA